MQQSISVLKYFQYSLQFPKVFFLNVIVNLINNRIISLTALLVFLRLYASLICSEACSISPSSLASMGLIATISFVTESHPSKCLSKNQSTDFGC